MSDDDRRAPVQASSEWPRHRRYHSDLTRPPGTISWPEHLEAWEAYALRYGATQSPDRIADRGGFAIEELRSLLGREPTTWMPREVVP